MGCATSKAVLVVDDDCHVRRVVAEMMSSRGYAVVEAEDGLEAWEKLICSRADIVVTDLQMPQCDGRELCRRIRAEPTMRHVRVIIVTGGALPECRQLDCDAVLAKPIFVDDLLEELERVGSAAAQA